MVITVSTVQKIQNPRTHTSPLCYTAVYHDDCEYSIGYIMIIPLQRVLDLLNARFVPEHVLAAVADFYLSSLFSASQHKV